ncbi:MAG: phage minor capsid protein, partial [Clostridiales bacterium]|nr:phage minor capsid protein [Clostridiales bacterium]
MTFKRDIEPKDKNDEHYKRLQEQRHNERMIRQWKRVEAGSLTLPERENAAR